MEDKIFELLTKMYSEMTEQFKEINNKLDNKADKSDIVRMENDLKPKVDAALEGYKVVYEKLTTLEEKVDIINSRVEKQDVEIRVIKGVKNM
ncbi:MAG TPA: hypothetical protein VEG39_20930 [Clostridia bacterium]|nr:hypothetical protein [Clostridia bacterium]